VGGDKLLTGGGDYLIKLWDIETQKEINTYKGHKGSIRALSCKYRDNTLFASGSRDGSARLWDFRAKCTKVISLSSNNSKSTPSSQEKKIKIQLQR